MDQDILEQIEEKQKITGITSLMPENLFRRRAITETFRPCCVGHTFTEVPDIFDGTQFIVQDFLVETAGTSGGGDNMEALVQIGLNAASRIQYTVLATPCKKGFNVSLPVSVPEGYFSIELGRQTLSPTGGFYDAYPATIVFNGLSGPAPVINYAWFFITNGNNDSFYINISGTFSQNFSFTSISVRGNYPTRSFLAEFGWYKPLSYAAPFGLKVPQSSCFVMFGYTNPTGASTDLGKVIEIV